MIGESNWNVAFNEGYSILPMVGTKNKVFEKQIVLIGESKWKVAFNECYSILPMEGTKNQGFYISYLLGTWEHIWNNKMNFVTYKNKVILWNIYIIIL